jgi:hypothetical protein
MPNTSRSGEHQALPAVGDTRPARDVIPMQARPYLSIPTADGGHVEITLPGPGHTLELTTLGEGEARPAPPARCRDLPGGAVLVIRLYRPA